MVCENKGTLKKDLDPLVSVEYNYKECFQKGKKGILVQETPLRNVPLQFDFVYCDPVEALPKYISHQSQILSTFNHLQRQNIFSIASKQAEYSFLKKLINIQSKSSSSQMPKKEDTIETIDQKSKQLSAPSLTYTANVDRTNSKFHSTTLGSSSEHIKGFCHFNNSKEALVLTLTNIRGKKMIRKIEISGRDLLLSQSDFGMGKRNAAATTQACGDTLYSFKVLLVIS